MRTISYTESRAKYAETLDAAENDREPVIITRQGRKPMVITSLEDYESLQETAYLLRSPVNAQRLLESIAEIKAGKATEYKLVEVEE